MNDTIEQASPDARKAALARAVQNEVIGGGTVESQSDYSAVIRWHKPVNHVLHLILSVITLTVWSWVWLVVWIVAVVGRQTVTLTVDEYGQVLRQKVR